jgi:ABC-2 type transport system permease protein
MMSISPLRVREMLKKELRQIFRDPRLKRMIFIPPLIQLIAFGYAVNTDIKNTATFVVDHDGSQESRELIDAFTSTGYFRVIGRSQRPAELVEALDGGDAAVGIEIPVDFARRLPTQDGARVQVIIDGTSSNSATVAQGYTGLIVQRYALERAAAQGALPSGAIDLRTRAWYNAELKSRVYNVPAVIGLLIMLLTLLLTALAVVREREMGTLDQLAVSPLSASELMLGKTLPVVLIALMDLCLIVALAILWFGIPMRGSFLVLLLASLFYITAGISVGLLISTLSRTQQEAIMTMFLFLLPAIILSGFFYPISSMPRFFQWLTLFNPVRHFLEIVRSVFLKGGGLDILWPQFLALLLMSAAVLRLAIFRFRRTIAA